MTGARPITQPQREAFLKAGWRPGVYGWWWPLEQTYVGWAFSGREALQEMTRRAKRAKNERRSP